MIFPLETEMNIVNIPIESLASESINEHQSNQLEGILNLPETAHSIVLFAHGSGSSRLSKRNQYVASVLNKSNIATLLFDLLTSEEEGIDEYTRQFRFDIGLLADRLVEVTNWIEQKKETRQLNIGYFGASTGGAAALVAAAKKSGVIKAVVSRGGRPDLAGHFLENVKAPTLLLVGGLDDVVIELNYEAFEKMNCIKKLEMIPNATHLFEEPGTLEQVAALAQQWFEAYLR